MLRQLLYLSLIISSTQCTEDMRVEPSIRHPHAIYDRGSLSEEDKSLLASVTFECKGRNQGYYVDREFGCKVFHYCDERNKKYSYKCKEGKMFDEVTSSCTYYTNKDCSSDVNVMNAASNKRNLKSNEDLNKGSRAGKVAFISRSTNKEPNNIHNPNQGLEALSAFASLSQSTDKGIPRVNLEFSPSAKIESVYVPENSRRETDMRHDTLVPSSSHPYPFFNVPSIASDSNHNNIRTRNRYVNENIHPIINSHSSNNHRIYDEYDPYSRSVQSSANEPRYDPTPRSYYHSSSIGIGNVFEYHPTVESKGNFLIQNMKTNTKESGKSKKDFPQSHFNFSPPGSKPSPKQRNSKSTIHDSVQFRGSLIPNQAYPTSHLARYTNPSNPNIRQHQAIHAAPHPQPNKPKAKPPSIFESPAPQPKRKQTSNSQVHRKKANAPPKNPHAVFLEELHENPFGSVPHYTPTYYFHEPEDHPESPQNNKYNFFDDDPYSFKPFTPPAGFAHFDYNPKKDRPKSIFDDEFYQTAPIRTTKKKTITFSKTSKIVNEGDSRVTSENSHPVHKNEEQPNLHIIDNPVIHEAKVTTAPIYEATPTLHVTEAPGKTELDNKSENNALKNLPIRSSAAISNRIQASKTRKRIKDKVKNPNLLNHELEPTTYAPNIRQNIKAPLSQVTSIPSRKLRLKNPRKNLRSSPRKEIKPQEEVRNSHEAKEVVFEETVEERQDFVVDNEQNNVAEVITTTVKPIRKPSRSSILRGSLKDRLSRLGTRRRILDQARPSANSTPKVTEEIKVDSTQSKQERKIDVTEKPTSVVTENPTSVTDETNKKREKTISPANTRRLRGRISNFFKERTPSRSRPRPSRRRLAETKAIIKKPKQGEEAVDPLESATVEGKETEGTNKETEKQEPQVKGKRKMSPDVRARFKEFLRKRKARLNRKRPENRAAAEQITEAESSKKEETTTTSKQNNSLDTDKKESDNSANESELMEKSIPLVRQEKVILLEENFEHTAEDEKSLSDDSFKAESSVKYDEVPGLNYRSRTPFRYTLNRNRKQKKTEVKVKVSSESPPVTTTMPKSLAERILDKKKKENVDQPPPTSITKHTVVRPSNFKQIVRMHPRDPSVMPSHPSQTTDADSMVNDLSKDDDQTVKSPTTAKDPEHENKKNHENIVEEKDTEYKISETGLNNDKNDQVDMNEIKSDDIIVDTEIVAKPVFNLDAVGDSLELSNKAPHISALDHDGFTEKISSVKFEPFTMSREDNLLPIERLLQV